MKLPMNPVNIFYTLLFLDRDAAFEADKISYSTSLPGLPEAKAPMDSDWIGHYS